MSAVFIMLESGGWSVQDHPCPIRDPAKLGAKGGGDIILLRLISTLGRPYKLSEIKVGNRDGLDYHPTFGR
jgi:hypothetical protein